MKYADIPTWQQWKRDSSSFLQWRSSKPYLVRIDKLILPYPNNVRRDVATLLKVQKGNLDGVSPVPPPRPA